MTLKISVDGGGLGAKEGERFGNYVFSQNLISALFKYDKKNNYSIYTFEKIKPRFAWSKVRLSIEELKERRDVFLALNQAIPLYVSGKVISFCHGLSYYFYPNLYSKKDQQRLQKQLNEMTKRSDYIIVSSEKVKTDLLTIKKINHKKIIVSPFGIPFDMKEKTVFFDMSAKSNYFLFVGMDHRIKNINFLKKVFSDFNKAVGKQYELKVITKNCSRLKLKNLYKNARALLTSSYYESFNLPVLEALSLGCPVIGLESAIIPEFKPYVNLNKKEKEFIDLMMRVPKKPSQKMVSQLKEKFSWQNYVKKLVKLY